MSVSLAIIKPPGSADEYRTSGTSAFGRKYSLHLICKDTINPLKSRGVDRTVRTRLKVQISECQFTQCVEASRASIRHWNAKDTLLRGHQNLGSALGYAVAGFSGESLLLRQKMKRLIQALCA